MLIEPNSPSPGVRVAFIEEDGAPEPRVDLYTKIPYANLHFLNVGTGFEAAYTVTAEIHTVDERGRAERLVDTHIWERTLAAERFRLTRSDAVFDRTSASVRLAPGRYLLSLELEDQSSDRTFVRELPLRVRTLRGPGIGREFQAIIEEYVATRYRPHEPAAEDATATAEAG